MKTFFQSFCALSTKIALLGMCLLILPQSSLGGSSSLIMKWVADSLYNPKTRLISYTIEEASRISTIARTAHALFKNSTDKSLQNAVVFRLGRIAPIGKVAQVVAIGGLDSVGHDRKVFLYYFRSGDQVVQSYTADINLRLAKYSSELNQYTVKRSGVPAGEISNKYGIPPLKLLEIKDLDKKKLTIKIGDSTLHGYKFEISGVDDLMRNEVEDVMQIIAHGLKKDGLVYELF